MGVGHSSDPIHGLLVRLALQGNPTRYAFDMPKLPPTLIDEETLALLNKATKAAKSSKAEVVRQCIRAQAPLIIAKASSVATFDSGLRMLKFDRRMVQKVRESRRADH